MHLDIVSRIITCLYLQHRTTRMNEINSNIILITKKLNGKKKWSKSELSDFDHLGGP